MNAILEIQKSEIWNLKSEFKNGEFFLLKSQH